MNTLRPFQLVLLAIFGILALVALVFLSMYQASRQQEELAYGERVLIWGTLPNTMFKSLFQEISKIDKPFNVVSYQQISKDSFDAELVNAIAEGRSPDLVILSADSLVEHRVKLLPIPYESLPAREFRDMFVDGAEIFAFEEGIYGIPFAVDPLLMYWNRDLFASNGLSQPPRSWEEVVADVVPRITVRTSSRDVTQSGVSFGEYRNVDHAKKILLMLALQTGSKMVSVDASKYNVDINQTQNESAGRPLESVVQFYTDFSNVNSPLYSWNRAQTSAKNAFLGGDLGIYFAPGSEYTDIANKNPNLNFDVTAVPQGANATVFRTYGDIYAFAIPKAAQNPQGAFAVSKILSSAEHADTISQKIFMAPARRDLIARGDENIFRKVALQSALISRAWLDPLPKQSDNILMQMIEDVVSNRARVGEAVKDAIDRLILAY